MEAPTVKTVGQQVRWMQYEGGQFYGGQLLPTRDFIFSLDLGKTFSVPLFSRPPGAPASVTIDVRVVILLRSHLVSPLIVSL
jgi:hypothetical protein